MLYVLFYCEVTAIYFMHFNGLANSKKSDKLRLKPVQNDILNTNLITVRFPKIEIPLLDRPLIKSKRLGSNVNPFPENCRLKTFRTELNQLRRRIKCEPREVVVDLISPPGATLTPNAVVVNRCGGMCNGFKKCLPIETRDVKFYIKTIRDNQLYCSSIIVPEDVKCKCNCKEKLSDCKSNQVYLKEKCSCICNNKKDYDRCAENLNDNMLWDENKCSCECFENKSCTTGTYWNNGECRCIKLA